MIVIETDRLILRHFTNDDFNDLYAVLGNPKVMKFSLNGPYSKDKVEEELKGILISDQLKALSRYAVIIKEEQKLIGFCGFFLYKDDDGDADYEIGYRFLPEYWGNGYATETAKATIPYAFNNHEIKSIAAVVEKENIASIRVLENAGMNFSKDSVYHGIPVMKYIICKK